MIFEKFAPFIQDYIYRNNWQSLREVQVGAAEVLFNTENSLLLTSSTASGKTEAAFFPIITRLWENETQSFGVLYIAPLKSLINDQFLRLDEVLDMSGIPVFHWHGDVAVSHKNKAVKNPKGILQITPESLESMLMNRSNDIVRLFSDLRYIVLDEVHIMAGTDRGNQVICQLARISEIIGKDPVRIGLSATVGDAEAVSRWLSLGSKRNVSIVGIQNIKSSFRLGMEHFYIQDNAGNSTGFENSKDNISVIDQGFEYIYNCTLNKKCLIFSNSREETEYLTATLRQIADRRAEPDVFQIHHGNLSSAIREEAELKLKDSEIRTVTCATVTLELGIDIGRLERIVQLDAPTTVSSFLQRLGRSGRRDMPSEMMMVFREENPLPNASLPNLIPWGLIRAIAIVQLYLEEQFIEPIRLKKLPFSLLFQQTLSILSSFGELMPKELANKVLSLPPFSYITKEQYRELLISMVKNEYTELTEDGGLIVGLKGEKLINSFKFYAVFKDNEDYTVRRNSDEIGSITMPPPVGDRFALAGRVWEVEDLDISRKLIYVKEVKGKMEISWPGDYGEIHTRILERMKQVLSEDTDYPYLKSNAKKRLETARRVAKNSQMIKKSIVCLGGYRWCLFPWLGTKAFRTMKKYIEKNREVFKISGIEYSGCYYITFKMERGTGKELIDYLNTMALKEGIDTEELISSKENPVFEKYDNYIPSELLRHAYAQDRLQADEVVKRLSQISSEN